MAFKHEFSQYFRTGDISKNEFCPQGAISVKESIFGRALTQLIYQIVHCRVQVRLYMIQAIPLKYHRHHMILIYQIPSSTVSLTIPLDNAERNIIHSFLQSYDYQRKFS